ncbi:MAG: alpha/beta hydrolase [Acidimicrobiia bacterium]|nr:alpha/beta hydrolase [Acidimicrobiia bacterium]
MKSHFVDVDGSVHYQEVGEDGPVLILVHGIGASYLSWYPVVEMLGEHHRVLAIDLIGHGFTPPHGRKATVRSNAELLADFADVMSEHQVILVGNSMGGLVSLLTAVTRPELVAGLILVNPALPIVSVKSLSREKQRLALPLLPLLGNSAARYYYHERTAEQEVDETFRLVLSDGATVHPLHRAAAVEMARARREMEWSIPSFTDSARSIAVELASARRFRRIIHQVSQPTLLIHGSDDRLVHPTSAEWAANERPDWEYLMIEKMGHTPQVEDPEMFTSLVTNWVHDNVLEVH